MNMQIPTHLLQEFHDLLALSSLELDLKLRLIAQVDLGELSDTIFNEILNLLREEARLDHDVERYSQEIINFDHDEYLNKVQQIVDMEVQKHLDSVQNSKLRTQS